MKHLWSSENRLDAIENMTQFISIISADLNTTQHQSTHNLDALKNEDSPDADVRVLLAKCNLKLGQWQVAIADDLNEAC